MCGPATRACGVRARLQCAQGLLAPAPEDALQRHPVGRAVGNPRNDSAELLEAVESQP